jgi:hypothetical protein
MSDGLIGSKTNKRVEVIAGKTLDPDCHIPSSFWQLIESANRDPETLQRTLSALDRPLIADLCVTYYEACFHLVTLLATRDDLQGSTEDALHDLADSIVAVGRKPYLDACHERGPLPDHDTRDSLPRFFHIFKSVFDARCSIGIFAQH